MTGEVQVADRRPRRHPARDQDGARPGACRSAPRPTTPSRRSGRPSELQPEICLVGRDVAGRGMATMRGICRAAPNAAVVVLADVRDGRRHARRGARRSDRVRPRAARRRAPAPDRRRGRRGRGRDPAVDGARAAAGAAIGSGPAATRSPAASRRCSGCLRRGQSTAAIAERLQIAPVTVRRHVSELVRKLGVEDRSELIAGDGWGQRGPTGNGNGNGNDAAAARDGSAYES